eukprot:CAMPEP_0174316490 /NCGR_PEP_ID=MMETSP0810-20121108/6976_1 /TAXON_ID=73025 ORGANISM="Eutreptiella gymnastica-like, Strain CCMP1594" /NCGR_SAMPLE_ID=MMETSP0810 /ASSEMBLY_ACC=CAM_ASM_000659 /LENGTH=56 /DNA_ID=CAMNT_0015426203 /DNA_START=370 /DNA_END=540 /DNA_ORIENTATION=+
MEPLLAPVPQRSSAPRGKDRGMWFTTQVGEAHEPTKVACCSPQLHRNRSGSHAAPT